MPLEAREHASVVTHALARETLTDLRDASTDRRAFRSGLRRLGECCGLELLDSRFGTESVPVETPLTTTTGARIPGRQDVVLVSILRAALPFVEGLQTVFPDARQGVISASRDEAAGMDADGEFPIAIEYDKVPQIRAADTVIVADPMLATGSTMAAVLDRLLAEGARPEQVVVLAAVSAPAGLERVAEAVPEADLVSVAIDEGLDENGFIVPGLGDAGDRAFGDTA